MADPSGTLAVRRAAADDLDALARLFDAYRQFYGRASDPDGASQFLGARLGARQSVLFLAEEASSALGFTQLYPSFSSVRLARTYVLNDLFVVPEARGRGIARALIKAAEGFAKVAGAARMELSTARNNKAAQALYRSLGWAPDETFITFYRTLD